MTTSTNDGCPNKSFDHVIFSRAYDEECARTLIPYPDHEEFSDMCGVTVVNDVLGRLLGELRVEAQFTSFAGLTALIMALQLGGISVPAKGHFVEITAWALWMLVVFLQMLTGPLAIGMVVAAFFEMRESMSICAVEWGYGVDMADIVVLATVAFQPAVLFPLVLTWLYWQALVEGLKVYSGANDVDLMTCRWKMLGCCGPKYGGDIDDMAQSMAAWFIMRIILPVCGSFFLLSILSLSDVFGVVFLPMLLFIMALDMLVVFALGLTHFHLRKIMFKTQAVEHLKDLMLSTIWWAEISTKWWIAQIFGAFEFFGITDDLEAHEGSFMLPIFWMICPIILSPLVVNGTWLAASVYAGHPFGENMKLVREIYEYSFGCFVDADFQASSLEFDLGGLGAAYETVLEALAVGFTGLQARELLRVSRAVLLLNFFFSLVKAAVSSAVAFLYLLRGDRWLPSTTSNPFAFA